MLSVVSPVSSIKAPSKLTVPDSSMTEVAPVPAQLAPQLFRDATGLGIHGGQFIAAQGAVHLHHHGLPHSNSTSRKRAAHRRSQDGPVVLSDNDLYCEQLWPKRRGFPLYVPAPQRNLPAEYLLKGAAIGDVGMVTAEGIWNFFFNLFHPADHPINRGRVPEGFVPLDPFDEADLYELDFDPGSFVALLNAEACNDNFDDFPGSDYIFRCSGLKGAILCLPFGSRLRKLAQYQGHVRDYAARHAKSWYKYINGRLGRGMPNGDLYIITGCEKAHSGGIATFQRVADAGNFELTFRSFPDAPPDQPGRRYRFNRGTPAQTKSFPPISTTPPSMTANNTVFVHGYRISLGVGVWNALFATVGVHSIEDDPLPGNTKGNSSVPFGSPSGVSKLLKFILNAGTGGKKNNVALSDNVVVYNSELTAVSTVADPSQEIHRYLLETIPDAEVVITHDDDWAELMHDSNASSLEDVEYLAQQLQDRAEIIVENGVVYLAARPEDSNISVLWPNTLQGDNIPATASDGVSSVDNQSSEVTSTHYEPPPGLEHLVNFMSADDGLDMYAANHRRSIPPELDVLKVDDVPEPALCSVDPEPEKGRLPPTHEVKPKRTERARRRLLSVLRSVMAPRR
ncbi:Pleiotropic drug resistance ABC transporter protein [Mycena kentingensis (nom. inval.)]|nr:Pleiotropic drug resistance ABC transporter protein [Mycena kentingensis (nom. inval.)]